VPAKVTPDGHILPDTNLAGAHESAQRVIQSQVRQAVLAEQLGFHYCFLTEHHFQFVGVEMSPNPLVIDAAIAVLTRRIRLGQAANIITWHNPVRLAETSAIVDVLSGGRLEMGLGRGYQPRETEVLGWPGGTVQDQEKNRALYDENLEILLKAWTQLSMSHHGEFFSVPPTWTKWNHKQTIAFYEQEGTEVPLDQAMHVSPPDLYSSGPEIFNSTTTLREISVFPQPLQKPHPQLWTVATSGRSIQWAANHGINAWFIGEPTPLLSQNIDLYLETAEKSGWPDRLGRGPLKRGWDAEKKRGVVVGKIVHIEDKGIGNVQKARQAAEWGWNYYYPFGQAALFADAQGNIPEKMTADLLEDAGFLIAGSVQQVIDGIMKIKEGCQYEDFMFGSWFEQPGLGYEQIRDQMLLFSEEVMPVLQKECGGSPELPDLGLGYTTSDMPIGV
jgi:alkanesulfonate monooxygenase SsuD/methylene tetrahydromethanopterin reductase-like flavin-dependent oxidoreductase (luciferase family)